MKIILRTIINRVKNLKYSFLNYKTKLTLSMADSKTCKALSKQSGPGPVLAIQIFSSIVDRITSAKPRG